MRKGAKAVALTAAAVIGSWSARTAADDGVYGRFDGDLTLSLEAGVSEAFGDESARGESLAARAGAFFVSTVGIVGQYNDSLGSDAQPVRRSLLGGVELRPLFLGRFAEDLERGPAHLPMH